jgi:hypothetical protein
VGRTGAEVGIVGTLGLVLCVGVGDIEDDPAPTEGKRIPDVEVDGGPSCRRCSGCTESEIQCAPRAGLGRDGNRPATESMKREGVKWRVERVTSASKSGTMMAIRYVRHPV